MATGVVRKVVRDVPGREGGRVPDVGRTPADSAIGSRPWIARPPSSRRPRVQRFRSALTETAALRRIGSRVHVCVPRRRGEDSGRPDVTGKQQHVVVNGRRLASDRDCSTTRPTRPSSARPPQRHHHRHPIAQPATAHHPDPRSPATSNPSQPHTLVSADTACPGDGTEVMPRSFTQVLSDQEEEVRGGGIYWGRGRGDCTTPYGPRRYGRGHAALASLKASLARSGSLKHPRGCLRPWRRVRTATSRARHTSGSWSRPDAEGRLWHACQAALPSDGLVDQGLEPVMKQAAKIRAVPYDLGFIHQFGQVFVIEGNDPASIVSRSVSQ
jgi:hypothetical protein